MEEDYFPQGIAEGGAFLGRDKEINRLQYNIESGHHTLLLAPRRFGKTSLARHVFMHMELVHAQVNFYLCRTSQSVEAKILCAVQEIVNEVSDHKLETVLKKISSYFSKTKKKWHFGISGLAKIEFSPDSHDDVVDNLLTALQFLDDLLQENKKKVVLFFDEIQELHRLDEGRAIQASIREFAQQSKHVVFIFSGSNRRLLNDMFDDKSMPLYELCERIKLTKIDAQIYQSYINEVAQKTKKGQLSTDMLAAIFSITKRHPKRVYNLCYALWRTYSKLSITADDVYSCWYNFVDERVNDVRMRLKQLSVGQLKVLTLIALNKVTHLTGKQAQHLVDLTSPTISYALTQLEQEDYIERDKQNKHVIIDPLVETVLEKYERYNLGSED